jgi:spermidine synthase
MAPPLPGGRAGPSRSSPRVVERRVGRHGELALLERDGQYELISNGVFLMDTRDGRSERLLVRAAVEHAGRAVHRLLLGGLGVGFSLAEALELGVPDVVVVECEPAVVAWNRAYTGARTGGSVTTSGVRCEVADLVTWLQRTDGADGPFDAICLDVDNGPDWLLAPSNAWLYADEGLRALQARLADGGALSVWSSAPAPACEARLRRHFRAVTTRAVQVARGTPDVVYLACT